MTRRTTLPLLLHELQVSLLEALEMYVKSLNLPAGSAIIAPTPQRRKRRPREVKSPAKRHTAGGGWIQDMDPDHLPL